MRKSLTRRDFARTVLVASAGIGGAVVLGGRASAGTGELDRYLDLEAVNANAEAAGVCILHCRRIPRRCGVWSIPPEHREWLRTAIRHCSSSTGSQSGRSRQVSISLRGLPSTVCTRISETSPTLSSSTSDCSSSIMNCSGQAWAEWSGPLLPVDSSTWTTGGLCWKSKRSAKRWHWCGERSTASGRRSQRRWEHPRTLRRCSRSATTSAPRT